MLLHINYRCNSNIVKGDTENTLVKNKTEETGK